jgi:neutral ceramidase
MRPFPVPIGTPMAGYMARTGSSAGMLDELTVSVLILRHGASQLGVIAADLAGVDEALPNEIGAACGLARSEIVLCASHTHSGPAGVVARLHPADDDRSSPELRSLFVTTCASAIAEAITRLEPVDLQFGQAETSGLAANRNDPEGPFDSRLSVIATRTITGTFSAILVHFACHPTILGADNLLISADYPGALRRALGESLHQNGPTPIVLYTNGAAGDVSTRFTRHSQDVTEVQRVGTGLAVAALAALENLRPIDGPIRYERQTVSLPPRSLGEPISRETNSTANHASAAERRREETRNQGAVLLAKLGEAGPAAIRNSLELEAWGLGDLSLVTISGELFASLGALITEASSAPTLVLGYANGYAGYLVDKEAYAAGTYEALASPFAPDAGETVAEAALTLANHVRTGQVK